MEKIKWSRTQSVCDALAFLAGEHDAAKVLVHAVRLVEADAVLGDHVERLAEDGPCFAVHRVRVAATSSMVISVIFSSAAGKHAWAEGGRGEVQQRKEGKRAYAACTSGLRLWMAEWMAKAAALMGWEPWTTVPDSSTRMRSETLIWEKCVERGFSPGGYVEID